MKQKLLLKTMLLLCALVVGSSSVWADTVSFIFTGGSANCDDVSGTISGISYETGKTGSATATAYNTTNGLVLYGVSGGGGYFNTTTAISGSITNISVTTNNKKNSPKYTVYGSKNGSDWTQIGNQTDGGSTASFNTSEDYTYIKIANTTDATAQLGVNSIIITYTPAAPAYTITAQSNNNSYGTVSLSGSIITGSPNSGYQYASPAYTVSPENSATVAQNGNTFTVTPSANTTVTINFEAIPSHTATFSVNGATTTEDFQEGSAITFPSDPSDIAGKTFVGWVSTTIDGTTNETPSFVNTASEEMGNSDITYYAVFATAEEGAPVETKTQTLQYDSWTYSGTTTDKTNYRLFGNGSYIVSDVFDLSKLSKVIVYGGTFGGGSYNSLTIGDGTNIWKSETVSGTSHSTAHTYTGGTALTGTKNLRITATAGNGTSTGLRISKVEIFTNEPSITYSKYCTTVVVTTVETPVISPASGAVASGTEVTITCATDGASIHYTTDGTTPTSSSAVYDPSNKPTITTATTIKAIGVKAGLNDSEVVSASYTIALPCATPTFTVAEGEVAKGTTVEILTETDGATIYYTTNGSTPTTSSLIYSGAITINTAQTIMAIAVKDGMLNSEVASVSYTVIDYATLPFAWAGGTKSDLTALSGVTEHGLGSDYAESHDKYRVKFDGSGDYIQIKTNARPGIVAVGVKKIGGTGISTITIQGSSDGTDFHDIEAFSINGAANAIVPLKTTKAFTATDRYVRLYFTQVSNGNVGVGPISIDEYADVPVIITSAKWASFSSASALDFTGTDVTAYIAKEKDASNVTLTEIKKVPANTGIVVNAAAASTYAIPVLSGDADATTGNLLQPWLTAGTPTAGTYYTLAVSGGDPIFKKSSGGTLAAGKAYLDLSGASAPVLNISFDNGVITGINTVQGSEFMVKGSGIYNLKGQKVSQPTKGLYIVNGKKVIIK